MQDYSMWRGIATVLLGVWLDVANGMISIQLIPQYPVIQGSVIFSVTGITENIVSINWFKGPTSSSDHHIFAFLPGHNITPVHGPHYNSRITVLPNGSLQISDLQTTDKGNYIVKIQTERRHLESSVVLTIYDPVSEPKITVSNPEPQEDDSITLTCASSNAERIIWSRGGGSLRSGAVLSSKNKTATFSSISRLDSGNYQCKAENMASMKISNSYTLTIAYGPENVNIEGSFQVMTGSVISLECVADSVPSSIYSWQFNGRNLTLQHNHTLLIEEISSMNEGNYTCEVKNLVTKRSTSASIFITVMESHSKHEVLAGLISGGVLAFALILIVVIMLCKRFSSPAKKEESQPEKENQTYKEIPEDELYANVENQKAFFTNNSLY